MEAHYSRQAALPHFSGHYRQRGRGFGALAAGIGRFALPLAKRFLVPAAKKIGRELLMQAAPELIDVVTKKKSAKQAAKNTIRKTVQKQVGGGSNSKHKLQSASDRRLRRRRGRQMSSNKKRAKTSGGSNRTKRLAAARKKRPKKTAIRRQTRTGRSRADFFSNVRHVK